MRLVDRLKQAQHHGVNGFVEYVFEQVYTYHGISPFFVKILTVAQR
jgi:hypothetical protein